MLTVDVNECALNNGGCDQVCDNSVGSFQCSCNRGYRLNLDRMTCSGRITIKFWKHSQINILLFLLIDINECSLNTDGCDQVCINTVGSFQCSCNRGYTLNADGITCSGMTGRITCIACNSEKDLSLYLTIDINECSLNNGSCDQVCNNSMGSFQCSCNGGYRLNIDGRNCSGKRVCSVYAQHKNF